MKLAAYILAAMAPLAWGVNEVDSYAEGLERVGEDGWVLLCHSADWDNAHDQHWMRRQTSVSSSCGSAMLIHVPIYQNPTPEQAEALENMLRGSSVNLATLSSVPCAILLDRDGLPYATIAGEDFIKQAAGLIRQAQSDLRTRNSLLRQAANEEGSQKAQTLSRISRLSIAPPPGLQQQIREADPDDTTGIAEWSPFDPWALAKRIHRMPWQEAIAELDRIQQAPLSKEERQAVLAIRLGCVHQHLGAAGVREIRRVADECTALAPLTPLAQATQRAAALWGSFMDLSSGWEAEELPRQAADCEVTGTKELARDGEYRIGFVPTGGKDALRVTRVALYDGDTLISEDAHTCSLKAGEPLENHEYMLIVQRAPARPRLIISFDQQGKTDNRGGFALRYFTADGIEVRKIDAPKAEPEQNKQHTSALPSEQQ